MRFRKERSKSQDWMDDFFKDVDKAAKDIEKRAIKADKDVMRNLNEEIDEDIRYRI